MQGTNDINFWLVDFSDCPIKAKQKTTTLFIYDYSAYSAQLAEMSLNKANFTSAICINKYA